MSLLLLIFKVKIRNREQIYLICSGSLNRLVRGLFIHISSVTNDSSCLIIIPLWDEFLCARTFSSTYYNFFNLYINVVERACCRFPSHNVGVTVHAQIPLFDNRICPHTFCPIRPMLWNIVVDFHFLLNLVGSIVSAAVQPTNRSTTLIKNTRVAKPVINGTV